MSESILIGAMSRLDEERVLKMADHMLGKGAPPMDIMHDMREGFSLVRQLYEQGKYFLADLMMGADIFAAVTGMLKERGRMAEDVSGPPVIIGTVRNDIHDIGKNIMVQLLQCKGYRVIDLGVDVAPMDFVRAAKEYSSRVLFLSGLLTVSHEPMKLTVQELEKNNLRESVKVVIGGLVSEQVRQFVRADYWTRDSWVGLDLCQSILFPRKAHEDGIEGEKTNGYRDRSMSHDCRRAANGDGETECSYPVMWIESGLHINPDSLRKRLQEELDHLGNIDRALLAFGYCGNALLGLRAEHFRLIFPRAEDCITLMLGSGPRR